MLHSSLMRTWFPFESHWDSGQGQEVKLRWALHLAEPCKAMQGNVDSWREERIEFLNANSSGQIENTKKQTNKHLKKSKTKRVYQDMDRS